MVIREQAVRQFLPSQNPSPRGKLHIPAVFLAPSLFPGPSFPLFAGLDALCVAHLLPSTIGPPSTAGTICALHKNCGRRSVVIEVIEDDLQQNAAAAEAVALPAVEASIRGSSMLMGYMSSARRLGVGGCGIDTQLWWWWWGGW